MCALLAACAQVQVRTVGTASGLPAYELRSRTMAQLKVEVERLCPGGHTVLRQWQGYQRGEREDSLALKTLKRAQDFVGADEDQAQATVQCKA